MYFQPSIYNLAIYRIIVSWCCEIILNLNKKYNIMVGTCSLACKDVPKPKKINTRGYHQFVHAATAWSWCVQNYDLGRISLTILRLTACFPPTMHCTAIPFVGTQPTAPIVPFLVGIVPWVYLIQPHLAMAAAVLTLSSLPRFSSHKNIVRHTAHTIVSWPNPKQWLMIHTSGLMMIR